MAVYRVELPKRKYLRLRLQNQFGMLSIKQVGEKSLTTSSRPVMIFDISAGGAKICTELKLPVTDQVVLSLHTELMNIPIELKGTVVSREPRDNMYEYGMKFALTPELRIYLIRLLNQLILRMNPASERIHRIYSYYSACYEQASLPVMKKQKFTGGNV